MAKVAASASDIMRARLAKKFGNTSVVDLLHKQDAEVIPTGIDVLDRYLLADGGLTVGRITELYGAEASGKTTLAYQIAANAQKSGALVVWVDTERAFDKRRAVTPFGVDIASLILLDAEDMEMVYDQLLEVLEAHNAETSPVLVVWDSVEATESREASGEKFDASSQHIGVIARIMSRNLKLLPKRLEEKRGHFLVLNQTRMKIGVMFGNPETTGGGNSLKFYASARISLSPGKALKARGDEGPHIGKIVTATAMKTRFSEPFRSVKLRLLYADGYDSDWSTLNLAKELGKVPAREDGKTPKGAEALAAARAALGW